jgi:hypothetical protein
VGEDFEPLTRRIEFSFPGELWLGRKEAEQDLDELEWLLEHRYAYLTRNSFDYRSALDSIRASLGDQIRRGTLALSIQKLLSWFGDGHTQVSDPYLADMGPRFLPFLVAETTNSLIAFSPDHKGFLDEQHPVLSRIDGRDVNEWLDVASQTVPRASPQFTRRGCLGRLRDIEYLRKELSLPPSSRVRVEVASTDGRSRRTLDLSLSEKRPSFQPGFASTNALPISRLLPGAIGYLQIYPWMSAEKDFLDELIRAMGAFRETKGLIIDVRGNGGGSRAPLRTLFPFFLAPDAAPQVLNVAAYRLGHPANILEERWLHPANWKGWTTAQRAAIQSVSAAFVPEWQLPEGQFSGWHYFIISPLSDEKYYYYSQPLVILMDGGNFSATDIFLGAFKGRRNVTLMGTPSGGGSGCFQRFRLRHSSIQVRLSSMVSFRTEGTLYDGNGIQPDVLIHPQPTDFIHKTDSTLDAACAWLKRNFRRQD